MPVYNAPRQPASTGANNWQINQAIPGLPGLTKSATGIIQSALEGLPSPSEARLENAYFGAGSGLDPTSDFLRNRGYDLYNRKANQRQQQGFQDLLALVGGYSGTVAPTPGQEIQERTSMAQLGQQGADSAARLGFEREQYGKQLELLQKYLGNPAGGTGGYNSGVSYIPPTTNAYGQQTFGNYYG